MQNNSFKSAKKFGMDKSRRNCFLAKNKLCIYHLIQNSSQFELLIKIGKALVSNLKNFCKNNNINSSLILIFDKATNLFTLKTITFETANFDTNCYIALNCILSSLKELLIWFFMFFTEFKVEKLLPLDILAKKIEKKIENLCSNFSGHMPLPNISE